MMKRKTHQMESFYQDRLVTVCLTEHVWIGPATGACPHSRGIVPRLMADHALQVAVDTAPARTDVAARSKEVELERSPRVRVKHASSSSSISFLEFSLCLTRACLGKMIVVSTTWRKKMRVSQSEKRHSIADKSK